jgi:hypothetical protein
VADTKLLEHWEEIDLLRLTSAFHEGVGGGRVGGFGSRGRRPGTVGGWSG